MSNRPGRSAQHPRRRVWQPVSLAHMQRLKVWHAAHHHRHPAEHWAWDTVLMFWMLGWTGWLPAYTFGAFWAYPLCLLCLLLPGFYVRWRSRADQSHRLRCDWLHLLD